MAHPSVLPVVRHSPADDTPWAGPPTSNLSASFPQFWSIDYGTWLYGEGFTRYGSH